MTGVYSGIGCSVISLLFMGMTTLEDIKALAQIAKQ